MPRFAQIAEPIRIQTLIPESAGAAFDSAVLYWLAGLNVIGSVLAREIRHLLPGS
jgi:hypothetical protein